MVWLDVIAYMCMAASVKHNYIHTCMAQVCLQWIMHSLMHWKPRVGSGRPNTSSAGAAGNGCGMVMAGMMMLAISTVHNAGAGGSNGIIRGLSYMVADEASMSVCSYGPQQMHNNVWAICRMLDREPTQGAKLHIQTGYANCIHRLYINTVYTI